MLNINRADRWKDDIKKSVDSYNSWFINFAPEAFKKVRNTAIEKVEGVFHDTNNLTNISIDSLSNSPQNLQVLRMATCPPLARDRLIGIAGISKNLVNKMEDKDNPTLPKRMPVDTLNYELSKAINLINQLLDTDILTWINEPITPTDEEVCRAITIIADRLCGADTNPIIRNAQEDRQLEKLEELFKKKGYRLKNKEHNIFSMEPGEYAKHINIPVTTEGKKINISIDWAFVPINHSQKALKLPILVEAKSAGDFTNVNKRRKEEAQKMSQLVSNYGKENVRYILYLTGYFDAGYLGYEAAEGIDWFWEHRISDIEKLL